MCHILCQSIHFPIFFQLVLKIPFLHVWPLEPFILLCYLFFVDGWETYILLYLYCIFQEEKESSIMYGNYDRKMFLHSLDLNKTRGGVFSLRPLKAQKNERNKQACSLRIPKFYSSLLYNRCVQRILYFPKTLHSWFKAAKLFKCSRVN